MSTTTTPDTPAASDAPAPGAKLCTGPCRRLLPLSAFGRNSGRRDGRRSECRLCRRLRRGPRGGQAPLARELVRELSELLGHYQEPALADVLRRALDEVRQLGASGKRLDEQVEAVLRAVLIHGCRRVDEIVEETRLSRAAVARALELLLAEHVVETRDAYRLGDEAEEAGRPAVEYHPRAYPRGDGFRPLFRREDGDEPHGLEVEP